METCGLNPPPVKRRLWTSMRIERVTSLARATADDERRPVPFIYWVQRSVNAPPRVKPQGIWADVRTRSQRLEWRARRRSVLCFPSRGQRPGARWGWRSSRFRWRCPSPGRRASRAPRSGPVPGGVEVCGGPPVGAVAALHANGEIAEILLVVQPALSRARQIARLQGPSDQPAGADMSACGHAVELVGAVLVAGDVAADAEPPSACPGPRSGVTRGILVLAARPCRDRGSFTEGIRVKAGDDGNFPSTRRREPPPAILDLSLGAEGPVEHQGDVSARPTSTCLRVESGRSPPCRATPAGGSTTGASSAVAVPEAGTTRQAQGIYHF